MQEFIGVSNFLIVFIHDCGFPCHHFNEQGRKINKYWAILFKYYDFFKSLIEGLEYSTGWKYIVLKYAHFCVMCL